MSVVDWAGAGRDAPVDENTPFEPRAQERGSYTRAKLEAEKLVSAFAKEHGLPTVILRPGQIFGGRIPLLTPAVARKAGRRWLVLGGGDVRLPLVYMDDVVDAILLAADGPLRDGEVIQLVDDYTPTQDELLAEVLGPGAKVSHVPRPILFGLGKFSELPLGLLKRQSPVAKYRLKSALARRTFRSVNAKLLGWSPRVGAREGIRRLSDKSSAGPGATSPAAGRASSQGSVEKAA
jgi:nucleoside-diphosphate-sugar epimerase